MVDLYSCSIESCGFKAGADRMWNLDRKATSGKLVVLCGRDAHAARERGLRAFRLAETFRRDAERQAERNRARGERDQFFARFGNARLSDALKASGNSRGTNGHSSRQEVRVE